jgi:hypothetical protein
MNLARLSQQIFKIKAALFAICIVIVLLLIKDRVQALGIVLVFMCVSTVGDIVLGYYKSKAGMGIASSLLIPLIMFVVFLFLSFIVLFKVAGYDSV